MAQRERKNISHRPEDTINAGKEFAAELKLGDVIGLKGDLGSGKTQFVKGVCEYFNVKDVVNSPTFLLVNEYSGSIPGAGKEINIYHFDLYRLKNSDELVNIGLENYMNENSICIIEWSGLAEAYLHKSLRTVYFEHGTKDNERIINFAG